MHSPFFHMHENPFGETPSTRFYYPSSQHERAARQICEAVTNGKGFAMLVGEVGSGKTLMSRKLLEGPLSDCRTALILHPLLEPKDLLLSICAEFEIPRTVNGQALSHPLLLESLYKFLIEGARKQKRALLVIDEAQRLPFETLEFVRLLSNLEGGQEKILQILLVGQPEIEQKLAHYGLRQLSERIRVRAKIEPLNSADVERYILHRLDVAGGRNFLSLDPSAITNIHRQSGGVPRRINFLCELILAYAEHQQKRVITDKIVNLATAGNTHPRGFWARWRRTFLEAR